MSNTSLNEIVSIYNNIKHLKHLLNDIEQMVNRINQMETLNTSDASKIIDMSNSFFNGTSNVYNQIKKAN